MLKQNYSLIALQYIEKNYISTSKIAVYLKFLEQATLKNAFKFFFLNHKYEKSSQIQYLKNKVVIIRT